MLQLRVRGKGGSSENCQAIVVNLRALRRSWNSGAEPPATFSPVDSSTKKLEQYFQKTEKIPTSPAAWVPLCSCCAYAPFSVSIAAEGCNTIQLWQEIWNIYDIAYDEFIPSRPSSESSLNRFILSYHTWEGKLNDTGSIAKFDRLFVCVGDLIHKGNSSTANTKTQGIAWLLSSCLLRCNAELCFVFCEKSPTEGQKETESNFDPCLCKFALTFGYMAAELNHLKFSVMPLQSLLSTGVECGCNAVFWEGDATVLSVMKGTPKEAVPQLNWHAVVLSEGIEEEGEDEQTRRENMVLNFCPCCGKNDGTAEPCHHH